MVLNVGHVREKGGIGQQDMVLVQYMYTSVTEASVCYPSFIVNIRITVKPLKVL